jgi:hypothetical protein
MSTIDLWPEQPTIQADQIEASFVLEDDQGTRTRCWYKVSSEQQSALTESCDPFILPAVFSAMQKKAKLVVHGQVSPSLLKNLTEFQTAWASWRPGVYKPVEITAEVERENELKLERGVLTSFSGGVDCAFTVWRHHAGLAGRQNLKIQAALMMHGFDIRLNQPQVFDRAANKAQSLLDSLGLKLVTIATNLKKTDINFEDAHAAILASCLMLFQGSYATGVIASSYPYSLLHFPYGSNPVTDRLFSSASFDILHDGAAFTRLEKVKALAQWPEASQYLRVCLRGEHRDENCCRCEKCIRTILEFRVLGLGLPPCFAQDVTDSQILQLDSLISDLHYRMILETAAANHISASWVRALKWSHFHNTLKHHFNPQLDQIRQLRLKAKRKHE